MQTPNYGNREEFLRGCLDYTMLRCTTASWYPIPGCQSPSPSSCRHLCVGIGVGPVLSPSGVEGIIPSIFIRLQVKVTCLNWLGTLGYWNHTPALKIENIDWNTSQSWFAHSSHSLELMQPMPSPSLTSPSQLLWLNWIISYTNINVWLRLSMLSNNESKFSLVCLRWFGGEEWLDTSAYLPLKF